MGASTTSGLQSRRRSGAAATQQFTEDILRLLARFGVATGGQIARHLGQPLSAIEHAQRTLSAQALIRPIPLLRSGGLATACTLTTAGLRRLPALTPKHPVHPSRMDTMLAAVDIALQVEADGLGTWLTWPEAVREGRVLTDAVQASANGLLVPAGAPAGAGRAIPVCIVLRQTGRSALRQRLAGAKQAAASTAVRVYAAPHLCGSLEADARALGATVVPWVPGEEDWRGEPAPEASRQRDALTPKRVRVLTFLARFGYATVDQLAAEQGTHSTAASIMLATLEKLGLVQRHRQHHLHKDVYSATALGISVTGQGLAPVPRVPSQRRHALGLVDLARTLCAETGGDWLTNRELVQTYAHSRNLCRVDLPDGILLLRDGRRVAVELELSSQARHTVLAFTARQLGTGDCQEVWYAVSPDWYRRYATRLEGVPAARVRAWDPPDRLGGPRGFRADRPTREPVAPRILGRSPQGPARKAGRSEGGAMLHTEADPAVPAQRDPAGKQGPPGRAVTHGVETER